MTIRLKVFICVLFLKGFLFSQNWNVFNKNYRYNYKYNFSQLVTNVMFADTVRQSGTDTVYALNRIGVECTGSCPTVTAALNPSVTYMVPNMPQFLQRNILKYSDGRVKLYDTTKIVIVPSCTLNQSWLFDSIYNKTAVCTNISTLTIFGITDSVKTMMINNADSLQLSKNFGIMLFPDPYGKNKYYRLTGIENRNSYDQNALFGEKVPNAWDFYNYQVGDEFCSQQQSETAGMYGPITSCQRYKTIIKAKTTTNTGYNYLVDQYQEIDPHYPCLSSPYNRVVTDTTLSFYCTYINVSNALYPGMVHSYISGATNLIRFSRDTQNNFYKFCGPACFSFTSPVLQNTLNIKRGYLYDYNAQLYGSDPNSSDYTYGLYYGAGFGMVSSTDAFFETFIYYCMQSFQKSNTTYFGSSCPGVTGIEENHANGNDLIFYPNPASTSVIVPIPEKNQLEISNELGQIVLVSETGENQKINISTLPNGIYFVTLKNPSHSLRQKLMISH